jgi:L-aspartate oxidase
MGANRLASNSLLECLVYGKRVVEKARQIGTIQYQSGIPSLINLSADTDYDYLNIKNELATLMTNQVGIIREKNGMEKALARIEEIGLQYSECKGNYNFHKIKSLADICRIITISAIEREESRGGHIRTDFPTESELLLHHIIQQKEEPIVYEKVRKIEI